MIDQKKMKEKLPEAGKAVIALDSDGNRHEVYRCGHAPDCETWKCSITGGSMMIEVVEWTYNENPPKQVNLDDLFLGGLTDR